MKPLTDFYKHRMMADGHLNKCIDCAKAYSLKHRADNIEHYREYDRQRASIPKRVNGRKAYARTEKGKAVISAAKQRYLIQHSLERAAHVLTGNAIRDGRIERKPCEVCGSTKVHAHHDDYHKPLEVRWLCVTHHAEHHKKERAKARAKK